MGEMIKVDHLTKRFGSILAVDGISFAVPRGEVLGFLGPNGAGKSTTMKMLTGFLAPTGGAAQICGFDIVRHPVEAKRRIGYLPEGAPLYSDMTPAGFLRFIAEVRGFSGAERDKRIDLAVKRTDLAGVLDQPIDTLSKGFKRRVGLAQALLHDPEVLILDEPTDGLDPNQKHEVRALIRELSPEKAIIISTHILEEVDAVCSRAIIIAKGRVVADGTPSLLEARSPYHNAVNLRLKSPHFAAARAELAKIYGVGRVEEQKRVGDTVYVRVYSREGIPILEEVSAAVRRHGWEAAEVRLETGRLEDVFRHYTAGGGTGLNA